MTTPLLRSRLLAAGYRDDEVRRMCHRLGLVSVRPGAYVHPDDDRLRQPEARHALAVRAAVDQLGPDVVVSHASAAVLLGIALWGVDLDRVHTTRPGRSGGRRTRHLHVHVGTLDADEIGEAGAVVVTNAARTLADLLRTLPFEQAVVAADDALHRGLVTVAELSAALDRASGRHGGAAAMRALAFADGRAESPGESRSRVRMVRAGLPQPDLQVPVADGDGRPLGQSDFGWPDSGVVGEFDGRVKYGRLLKPGQEPGDAVFAEKVREDAIRDGGQRVTRWIWSELDPFDELARRLRRTLESGLRDRRR